MFFPGMRGNRPDAGNQKKWSQLSWYEKVWATLKKSGNKAERAVFYGFIPFFLYMCANADNQTKSQPALVKAAIILQALFPISTSFSMV